MVSEEVSQRPNVEFSTASAGVVVELHPLQGNAKFHGMNSKGFKRVVISLKRIPVEMVSRIGGGSPAEGCESSYKHGGGVSTGSSSQRRGGCKRINGFKPNIVGDARAVK